MADKNLVPEPTSQGQKAEQAKEARQPAGGHRRFGQVECALLVCEPLIRARKQSEPSSLAAEQTVTFTFVVVVSIQPGLFEQRWRRWRAHK